MYFLKLAAAAFLLMGSTHATDLERIKYNNPGLKVDLGVGLWAWALREGREREGARAREKTRRRGREAQRDRG